MVYSISFASDPIFVKHLISRSLNTIKALGSYGLSTVTGRANGHWMPVFIGIELTNRCNLNCPECLTGSGRMTRPKGFMSLSLFDRILDEAGPYLYNMNLYFQGEPMMHPDFFLFLERAFKYKTILSTNGHFLSPVNSEKLALSGLNTIIVSLDGMDQTSYSAYRQKGDFRKVIEGIKSLSSSIKNTRSRLRLKIQFLVNSRNETQIAAAEKFAREVNAVLILKSMQVLDQARVAYWLPSMKKLRRYRLENESFIPRSSMKNRCLRLWLNPVITWDGKVIPCCFDKDAEHILGDMNFESFEAIWKGEKTKAFRQSLLDDRSKIVICRNCTTGIRGVKI